MELIKKQVNKVLLVLVGSFIFTGCSQQDDNNVSTPITAEIKSDNQTSNLQRRGNLYSGEELFKSIFFGQGEFAKNISLYNDVFKRYDEGQITNQDIFISRYANFVKTVTKNNPDFFKNFQTNIYSGNPFTVQNALKTGSVEIYNNVSIIAPELANVIASLDSNPEVQTILNKEGDLTPAEQDFLNSQAQEYIEQLIPCGPLVCVAYFALAVHNTIGATVNIGIYLNVKFWGPKLDNAITTGEDTLKNEILINDIVTAVK